MSQKKHSRAHRSRTYKRVRGVILILLVLGIIWGITALVRHNAAQPDPTPDPNAGQQTGTTDEKQNNQTPDPDPDPEPSPDPAPEPTPDPTPDPKPTPDPEPSGTNLTNPGSDDWRTILVSAKYPLAEELDMEREFICNYAGFDLKVDARIAQPLRDFLAAAKADGYDLQLISAYRTFARSAILLENEVQAQMKYNGYSREKAEQVAATRVAPPGTSEHNTGLAVDILSGDYYYHHSTMEESFEYDAEAIWMAEHCAEYGFILRYPKGITGSWEACALSGRRLAPSASTSTKSASCTSVPIESRGAQSLPLSACEATQTMPDRSNAAETAASVASSSVSYCFGRQTCVVVAIMTLPFFESSPASVSISVVFPPPDGPTTTTNSPASAEKVMPSAAATSTSPILYTLRTSLNSTNAMSPPCSSGAFHHLIIHKSAPAYVPRRSKRLKR